MGFSVTFSLTAIAKKTISKMISAARNFATAKEKLTREVAIEVGELASKGILDQQFTLAPLTKKYAAEKAKKGMDGRILVATGKYAMSFSPVKVGKNEWGLMAPMPLALWSEFGTKNQPARPHMRPAVEKVIKSPELRDKFLSILFDREISGGLPKGGG